MSSAEARRRVLGDLIAASHVVLLEQVPSVVAEHAARAGWSQVLIYLADLQEDALFLLTGQGPDAGRLAQEGPEELAVEGTVAGRAFQLGQVLAASSGPTAEWWVPLVDGTERMGVLRMTEEAGGGGEGREGGEESLRNLAGLVALLLVSKRAASDSYSRLVRRRRMNVAAEMEWRLTPPRTMATDRVLISALMEPAYEVSGDAFDYAMAADTVHLDLFDAMGHDTAAGLTANLAVAACRNHRRQGGPLEEAPRAVEKALVEQFGGERYATGFLGELNSNTGELRWVNRGHPTPVVIRGGRTVVPLSGEATPPMGTDLGLADTVCVEQLEPEDRLLVYTDGFTEARNPDGEEFGLTHFTDFLTRHHSDSLPAPETLRRLVRHHLRYHRGQLRDDASVMLIEWHGPTPYPLADVESFTGLPARSATPEVLPSTWGTSLETAERPPV
ncbi:PP2C family protein-serine/threonine phosphatase [Streptomyces axinellae]|uniref:PP2C family protein-serine/threonine phosphatase n=1 Tax=Streptomyces axinellae TaxID=552788 RepID=A0ABP6CFE9_9ACTN